MDLRYSSSGEIIVSMDSYITEAIDKFPEEVTKRVETLAGNHLFKVENLCDSMSERKKILFHWMVAKIIFLINCAISDIQPTIAFLPTRVRIPDKDSCKKLRRFFSYLHGTMGSVKLNLKSNNLNVIHSWVDASYGTHSYIKGQTGETISIRKGCVTSASKKQKVNTTSSNISKVVDLH